MDSKMFIISSIFVLSHVVTSQQGGKRVECIDKFQDYVNHRWDTTTGSVLQYAATSQDLPGDLKGRLDGHGIFYCSIEEASAVGRGMWKPNVTSPSLPSHWFYIKYYAHILQHHPDKQMAAYMGHEATFIYLPPTSNFTWGESLVQLSSSTQHTYTGTWAYSFGVGESYLIDKIIVAQGYPSLTLTDIKNLCPFE